MTHSGHKSHPTLAKGLEDIVVDQSAISRVIPELKSLRLLAGIPRIIASHYWVRQGLKPIPAREDISFPENFFHMCFDRIPPKEVVNALNISLILYAEHTFNASTFTARVISSSWSGIYSAVCGAIGSLKGPLHGGANEEHDHKAEKKGN